MLIKVLQVPEGVRERRRQLQGRGQGGHRGAELCHMHLLHVQHHRRHMHL